MTQKAMAPATLSAKLVSTGMAVCIMLASMP
jgi:hypothetical protein